MELELGLALPAPARRELDLLNSAAGSCRKRCFVAEAALGVGVNKAAGATMALFRDGNGPSGGGDGDAAGNGETSNKRKKLVGWPPVKSAHRRCCGGGGGYVKVKMEGVAIGRKVDLSLHGSYDHLLDTLRVMFPVSTHQPDSLDGKHRHRDHDHAVTYEDGDGDWKLVGDVPWETIAKSAKRLKILV